MAITATVGGIGLSDHNLPIAVTTDEVLAPKVTIRLTDSACCWTAGASQADAVRIWTVANWPTATLALYVDDTAEFINNDTAKLEPAERWIAAGYEFGTDGYSGDPFFVLSPLKFTYSGSDANPQITISNNGQLFTFTTTEGNDDVEVITTKDTLVAGYQVDRTGIPFDSGLYGYLQSILAGVWTYGTVSGGGLYDDTFNLVQEDGTYDSAEAIPYNEARRYNEEINVSIADIEIIEGQPSQETYLYRYDQNVDLFVTKAQAYNSGQLKVAGSELGFKSRGTPMRTAVSDWFRVPLSGNKETIAAWGSVESTIRDNVDTILTDNSERWIIMECPITDLGSGDFEAQQIEWMIDQFATRGCEIVSAIQAYNSLK